MWRCITSGVPNLRVGMDVFGSERWAPLTSTLLPSVGNYLMAVEMMTVIGLGGRGQRNLCMGIPHLDEEICIQ
jgi:hypothetical protein